MENLTTDQIVNFCIVLVVVLNSPIGLFLVKKLTTINESLAHIPWLIEEMAAGKREITHVKDSIDQVNTTINNHIQITELRLSRGEEMFVDLDRRLEAVETKVSINGGK